MSKKISSITLFEIIGTMIPISVYIGFVNHLYMSSLNMNTKLTL